MFFSCCVPVSLTIHVFLMHKISNSAVPFVISVSRATMLAHYVFMNNVYRDVCLYDLFPVDLYGLVLIWYCKIYI